MAAATVAIVQSSSLSSTIYLTVPVGTFSAVHTKGHSSTEQRNVSSVQEVLELLDILLTIHGQLEANQPG